MDPPVEQPGISRTSGNFQPAAAAGRTGDQPFDAVCAGRTWRNGADAVLARWLLDRRQRRRSFMPSSRTMRPLYVDRLPPCNHACPAGENVQAWLAEAQARPLPRRPGTSSSATIRCRRFTGASAITPARTPAIARKSTTRSASTPSSGSSATWRSPKAGRSRRTSPHPASASSSSAPARAASRQPGTWLCRGHAVVIYDAGPMAGGMMHFGIPEVPPATRSAGRLKSIASRGSASRSS